jgi:hypothetical protein
VNPAREDHAGRLGLLPCPFCGQSKFLRLVRGPDGPPLDLDSPIPVGTWLMIGCSLFQELGPGDRVVNHEGCGASSGLYQDPDVARCLAAVAAWNRRQGRAKLGLVK